MEDQEQKTIRAVIYGFVLLVFLGISSCQFTNHQIRSSIDAGASPLAAKCAFDSSSGSYCDVLAAAEAEAEAARNR